MLRNHKRSSRHNWYQPCVFILPSGLHTHFWLFISLDRLNTHKTIHVDQPQVVESISSHFHFTNIILDVHKFIQNIHTRAMYHSQNSQSTSNWSSKSHLEICRKYKDSLHQLSIPTKLNLAQIVRTMVIEVVTALFTYEVFNPLEN